MDILESCNARLYRSAQENVSTLCLVETACCFEGVDRAFRAHSRVPGESCEQFANVCSTSICFAW